MKNLLIAAVVFGVIIGLTYLRGALAERAEKDRARRLGDRNQQ